MHLVRQLFSISKDNSNQTKTVYPFIAIEDVYFDQKSLKLVLDQIPLIYDAIGVEKHNNGSTELELASSGTPRPLEFEKSWWEYGED